MRALSGSVGRESPECCTPGRLLRAPAERRSTFPALPTPEVELPRWPCACLECVHRVRAPGERERARIACPKWVPGVHMSGVHAASAGPQPGPQVRSPSVSRFWPALSSDPCAHTRSDTQTDTTSPSEWSVPTEVCGTKSVNGNICAVRRRRCGNKLCKLCLADVAALTARCMAPECRCGWHLPI